MRVDERYLRYALALAFALGGLWAFLVRGDAWPFAMQDLQLGPHATLIAQENLESALLEDVYDRDRILGLSQRIAGIDPLSPLPYEAMLAVQLERETVEADEATALAQAALRRDARNLSARLFLVDQAILDQRWDDAFAAFGKAYQLWPTESVELRGMMYESLNDRAWSDAFIARLGDVDTGWEKSFVQQLPLDLVDIETAIELNRAYEDQHERLLSRIQREIGMDAAFIAWKSLRPSEAALDAYGRIDFDFQSVRALSPFNWDVNNDFAELNRIEGGLNISYRGRQRPMMARQIIYLPSGSYQFGSHLSEQPTDPSGDLVWEMVCVGDRTKILDVSVFDPAFLEPRESVLFEVPADCEYQIITLAGYPGTFTRRFNLTIDHISIAKVRSAP